MNKVNLTELLEKLIALPKETECVEFKLNKFEKEEIGEIISGLSNSANLAGQSYGYLVFGVDDRTHEVLGTNLRIFEMKVGNEEIEHWLNQMYSPRINFEIHEMEYGGKNVYIFRIPAAIDRPVNFRKISYVRIGSITRKLIEFPDKEQIIWINAKNKSLERMQALNHLKDDDIVRLLDCDSYFTLTKQAIPRDREGVIVKMAEELFIQREDGGRFAITNMGAILFARDVREFQGLKRKTLRVIVYEGKDRIKTKKELEITEGYAKGYEKIINFISDQLPANEEIKKAFRTEKKMYPEIAIRELVANALIHQDFSQKGCGTMFEIFDDRIEISNPGIPLIEIDRFIDHRPWSRNEDLAAFMRRIKICEERGSGIDKVINSIEAFQLPAPNFEIRNNFTVVTLFAPRKIGSMNKADKIRACYQHCCLKHVSNDNMTNASLRERFGIDEKNYPMASRIIRDTIFTGLIKKYQNANYVPYWA